MEPRLTPTGAQGCRGWIDTGAAIRTRREVYGKNGDVLLVTNPIPSPSGTAARRRRGRRRRWSPTGARASR
ncbi:hypothetical protein FAZ69_03470 [Trinickia terrae]|uniref:Uncharacterized protein n=1 Tax=Trinickia terrae TaxID=2571161 RepID=A0A4U1IDV7_9BURK|nr:hypothetical protein FAZ69_03470 [Trinickia terrae]